MSSMKLIMVIYYITWAVNPYIFGQTGIYVILASTMAIAVLADRRDIYNEAVEYLLDGIGNGCLQRTIVHVF